MVIEIQNFRNLDSANRVLTQNQDGGSVRTKGSHFLGKAVTWIKDVFGDQDRVAENLRAKNDLYQALIRSEGQQTAKLAMKSVLGRNWKTDFRSLSGSDVKKVLDKACHIRMGMMSQNQMTASAYGNSLTLLNRLETAWTGFRHSDINITGTPLGNRLAQARQENGYPVSRLHDTQVFERFMTLVSREPQFTREPISQERLGQLADKAISEHYQGVQERFDHEHPGLARYGKDHPEVGFRSPSLLRRLAQKVEGGQITFDKPQMKEVALHALQHLQDGPRLLGEVSFDHGKATQALHEIAQLADHVQQTRLQLDHLVEQLEDHETPPPLLEALHQELESLAGKLESKRTMLQELKTNHPFSEKNVSYTRFMLAETAKETAFTHLSGMIDSLTEQRDQAPMGSTQREQLQTKLDALLVKAGRIMQRLDQHALDAKQAHQGANPDQIIPQDQVSDHPLFRTEGDELKFINQLLKNDQLGSVSKKQFQRVRDQVLNTRQDWSPIQRTMVTRHQRTTQLAQSTIRSGIGLEGSFVHHQLQQRGLQGVSSHTKTEVAPEIPKNLQHSTLTVDGKTRVDMIRHGIIANPDQAKSVVSTAIWSDPVLRQLVLDRLEQDDPTPIDYSFANVNLESPWSTKIPVMGQRRVMQDAHISAFRSLAEGPQPVEIPFMDQDGEQKTIRVNLKVSVLGIPVNNAVGFLGKVGCVWSHLEQTNREGLQSLIGDLGDPSRGVQGSARGTPIGGMVGTIVRSLDQRIQTLKGLEDPSEAQKQELAQLQEVRGNVQEAVDIVRDIYCSGSYKEDDGNRYKFALAVMFATNLAKQAHTALGMSRGGHGFGSSQGCMSNKDRGGNADALLKSLNLSSSHAFKLLRYNTELNDQELVSMLDVLPPEDAKNMLITGLVYSGQLEAQKLQTLVMGSKNAGDLMEAIKNDPEAYPLLKGLSTYAKA